MGFSRQEYWSGVPLPSPTDKEGCTQIYSRVLYLHTHTHTYDWARFSLQHAGSFVLAGKLLVAAYGIRFPDQGSNLGPLNWKVWGLSHWTTREVPEAPFKAFKTAILAWLSSDLTAWDEVQRWKDVSKAFATPITHIQIALRNNF